MSRWENRAGLDRLVSEWTGERDHYEVTHLLQKAGVPASAVLTNKELRLDPHHLKERDFFEIVDHPETGKRPYPRMVNELSKTPGKVRLPGHRLGQHNERGAANKRIAISSSFEYSLKIR